MKDFQRGLYYTMCYSISREFVFLGHHSVCVSEFLIQLLCVGVCHGLYTAGAFKSVELALSVLHRIRY